MTEATQRAGVALSVNLTSGVFVNQSAAFSDYHATGANPAANARTPPITTESSRRFNIWTSSSIGWLFRRIAPANPLE
jgi:hypothetical protein